MRETPKSNTDKIMFKIKDNKFIAPIIVFVIIMIAIISFWEKVKPYLPTTTKKTELLEKKEYEAFDFILEQYNPDTLKAQKSIHSIVARRDFEMHFLIPSNWDLEEPLEGPAGLRFKSYYLPRNAQNIITASANITCIDDLVDSTNTFLGSVDSQIVIFKKLSGLNKKAPNEGLCTLDEYVNYQIEEDKKGSTNFHLFSISPAFKYFVESPEKKYLIEAKRIKYSFDLEGKKYIVMKLIAFIDKVGFILQFGAPKGDYNENESLFIEVTNYTYFKRM